MPSQSVFRVFMCAGAVLLAGCGGPDRRTQPGETRAQRQQAQRAADPQIADVLSNDAVRKGDTLKAQGKTDEALREFERAIERNPRLTIAYLKAGDIYRETGDFSSAEEKYRSAATLEPRNFDAQYFHGFSLQMLNRLTEAVSAYLRALAINSQSFDANLNLATTYLQLGEAQQGVPYAERAVRINVKSAPARTNLGAVYAALDRHDEAVIEYQQAAELAPLSAPLLLNLADSLGRTKRYAEMANTLEQLIKTEPSAAAYERMGFAQFKLRKYEEAMAAFRKSLEIDASHFPALNGVGVCRLNTYLFSDRTDENARQEGLTALRKSLLIERNQPQILELVTRFN